MLSQEEKELRPLRYPKGAGKVAWFVKSLPCNHEEDLSSNPEPDKPNLGKAAHACDPSAGEVETSGSLGPGKQAPSQLGQL